MEIINSGFSGGPAVAKIQRHRYTELMAPAIHPVWQHHPGLVWSNRHADDTVRIRAALSRPRFDLLLDLSVAFGLTRLHDEWAILEAEGTPETRSATPIVARILRNIEEGFRRADTGN